MISSSESLDKLVFQFCKLPGVGRRTATRYAYAVLEMSDNEAKTLAEAITEVKEKVHECKICGAFTDKDVCDFCSTRDQSVILVVKEPKDIYAFEKMQNYGGVYHVLHGAISPMYHVTADDIHVKELLKRIKPTTREVILGLGSDVEGEATAMYITALLKPLNVSVSRLAFGIPIGQDIEYADEMTLSRAFAERKKL